MSNAALEREAGKAPLTEERLGVVLIDGARYVGCPRAERIAPRPIEPADLAPAPRGP